MWGGSMFKKIKRKKLDNFENEVVISTGKKEVIIEDEVVIDRSSILSKSESEIEDEVVIKLTPKQIKKAKKAKEAKENKIDILLEETKTEDTLEKIEEVDPEKREADLETEFFTRLIKDDEETIDEEEFPEEYKDFRKGIYDDLLDEEEVIEQANTEPFSEETSTEETTIEEKDLGLEDKNKKDLSEYFEDTHKKKKYLKDKVAKEKKTSKRQLRKELEIEDYQAQKVYRYKNKKYTKVEDFIIYLNDHYLDIDEIAQEVLNDEKFYGWISKRSGVFDESLKKFKEIKEKIEK